MSRYRFTPAQRYAVYVVHGEKCYVCGRLLDLVTMEIDHVIPESLLGIPNVLRSALETLGRPADFDLNSFANWLPICRPCNLLKLARVFEPSLLVQLLLQRAADKAQEAHDISEREIVRSQITRALNTLQRAGEAGELSNSDKQVLDDLIRFQLKNRNPEMAGREIRLTPLYTVLAEIGGVRIVKGPFGVGGRPATENASADFDCPNCGSIAAWNGARCIICGNLSDD